MERSARQYMSDGVQSAEDLVVSQDSDLFRQLNQHYNRNNQLEVREIIFRILD